MTDVICGACGDILKTIPEELGVLIIDNKFVCDEKELTVWCENCQKLMPDDYKKYASKKFKDWNKRILELVKKLKTLKCFILNVLLNAFLEWVI